MCTVYPKKYAHGFVVLCFVVVMQSFIMNSHEVFIHIHQSCFAGTGAIVRLPQCQWSKPDGYGEISQCITTTKHSKAKTVCIFLGIYCWYVITPMLYVDVFCDAINYFKLSNLGYLNKPQIFCHSWSRKRPINRKMPDHWLNLPLLGTKGQLPWTQYLFKVITLVEAV